MATINDIGIPGQPLGTPPLTAWQAAVRDALTDTVGAITPAAGWALSATYDTTCVKRNGRVNLNVAIQRTSDLAITAGTYVTILNLPAGFFPASGAAPLLNGIYSTGNTVRIEVLSNGTARARFATAFTFTTGMDLGFTTSYRHV